MTLDDIIAPVKPELEEFEIAFAKMLHSNVPLAEQVVQYISTKKGKRLRPLLVFLSAKLHGALNEKTLSAGIVVEMLHTATLIHDDVVDESSLRRGSPTVNTVWDNKISVLVGDFLFSKTLISMLELKDPEAFAILSETAKLITEGELLQVAHDRDFEMNEEIYFDLISKKTAALFRAACELGALSINSNGRSRENMRKFGENLGIAFQIKDDLLDYVGDERQLGKPTGNDLRENKVTLPLIFALSRSEKKKRMEILDMLEQGVEDDGQIEEIIRFVNEQGGVQYSMQVAQSFAAKAAQILDEYTNSDMAPYLKSLVDFSIRRNK